MVEIVKNTVKKIMSFSSVKRIKSGRSKSLNLKNISVQRHRGGKKIKDGYGKHCARHCSCGLVHPLTKGVMDTTKTMAIKNK